MTSRASTAAPAFSSFANYSSGLSNPESIEYMNPEYFTGRLPEVWRYYARVPPGASADSGSFSIDRRALTQLAIDCVKYFDVALERAVRNKFSGSKWKDDKINAKIAEFRGRYCPAKSFEENCEIGRLFWAKELKFHHGAVNRNQFFLAFAKAHQLMYQWGELTLDRERCIEKWRQYHSEKAKQSELASFKPLASVRSSRTSQGSGKTPRERRGSTGSLNGLISPIHH
jgi:hypothetical protein